MSAMLETTDAKFLTTREAAAKAGVTKGRICQLIWSGEIEAKRVGTIWLIPENQVEKIKIRPTKVGRPRSSERK